MEQEWLRKEIEEIFKRQNELRKQKGEVEISSDFKDKVIAKMFHQRPLKSFEDKVGECRFFEGEKRAAKDSLSAMEFVALTRIINTLQNLTESLGKVYGKEKIQEILKIVLDKGEVNYKKLCEILDLPDTIVFRDPKLDYTQGIKKAESLKFIELKNFKSFKKALGGSFEGYSRRDLDEMATCITLIKDQIKLTQKLKGYSLRKEQIEAISELNFSKHINLSLKALEQILPYMRGDKGERCMRYDEAVMAAGLKEKSSMRGKQDFLPPLNEFEPYLANPVVARAISECRKIINSLIGKYGRVHKIHIEFAREAKLSSEERGAYEKEQKNNFKINEAARKEYKDIKGREPNKRELLKWKLWKEQEKLCLYSGEEIKDEHLNSPNVQVDHIYPYSRSFDDSFMNKVLVFTQYNQNKGNQTPYEFFKDKPEWEEILSRAEKLPKRKARRIYNMNFVDKEQGFKERNLCDTAFIARLMAEYIGENLEFLPLDETEDTSLFPGQKGSQRHIEVVHGTLTAMMRHYLGLGAKNRDNHLHHAIDAIIIGCMNSAIVKKFSDFKKNQETNTADYYTKKIKEEEFKKNRKKFFEIKMFDGRTLRDGVSDAIENIFISKPPRKRARGALHEETFYSGKTFSKQYGGMEGIKKALDFGKIRKIGTKIIKNGGMVRVDIFKHKESGKFYAVPIYTMDVALGILPNKAVIGGKKNGVINDWKEMNENYKFQFSLFKDDLIYVQKKRNGKTRAMLLYEV